MSRNGNIMTYALSSAIALWLIAGCMPVTADVLGVETWTDKTLKGWSCRDTVNECTVGSISAGDGFLDVTFPAQSMKMPPLEYMVRADTNASGGVFAGNYFNSGVQVLSFRVFCEYESVVNAIIHGDGKFWRYRVCNIPTGMWVNVAVPVSPTILRSICITNNVEEFVCTLKAVDWMGIAFLRNKTLNGYHCYVDDVTLFGAGAGYGDWIDQFSGDETRKLPEDDPNGNGFNNLSEWIAGTDPFAEGVAFGLESIEADPNETGGFTLKWRSVSGRQYQVWRTDNLVVGFSSISDWIPAIPPTNTYTDASAPASGQCFYNIKVRKIN